jgi:hypothetical protein
LAGVELRFSRAVAAVVDHQQIESTGGQLAEIRFITLQLIAPVVEAKDDAAVAPSSGVVRDCGGEGGRGCHACKRISQGREVECDGSAVGRDGNMRRIRQDPFDRRCREVGAVDRKPERGGVERPQAVRMRDRDRQIQQPSGQAAAGRDVNRRLRFEPAGRHQNAGGPA